MDTTQQIKNLIHKLRERPHVVEFAKGCAERAREYVKNADDSAHWNNAAAAAAAAADYVHYAADTTTEAVNAYAAAVYAGGDAASAAVYSSTYYAADKAYDTERELQLTHLKELHTCEEQACPLKNKSPS